MDNTGQITVMTFTRHDAANTTNFCPRQLVTEWFDVMGKLWSNGFWPIQSFQKLRIICCQRCNVAELFPCSSCDEIQALSHFARSGLYVIESGNTLKQASVFSTVWTDHTTASLDMLFSCVPRLDNLRPRWHDRGYLYSAQRKWHNGENNRLGLGLGLGIGLGIGLGSGFDYFRRCAICVAPNTESPRSYVAIM